MRGYKLGRRQAAVDRTRARILKAARALLGARGSTEFSIDAVAQRARVTRATVYQRFGSRPKLLQALFDDLAREGGMWDLRKAFALPDPDMALEKFVATFAHFWTVHRAIQRRVIGLGALDTELGRTLVERQEWRRGALNTIVQRFGIAKAAHADAVDVLFTLTSFQTFDMLAGAKRTPEDVLPQVLQLARAVLGRPDA